MIDGKKRTFNIFTEPSTSDPSWIVACSETGNNGGEVRYSDYSALIFLVNDCERKRQESKIRSETIQEVISVLGVSFEEYCDLRKSFSKKSL